MKSDINIKQGSVIDIPVTLTDAQGEPIVFTGNLWFMVKENIDDLDEDAIIDKEIEIVSAGGVPHHGILELDADDTSHPVGRYFYDLKTNVGDGWLSTDIGKFCIVNVVRKGNPTND